MTGQGPSSKEAVLTRHSGVGFLMIFPSLEENAKKKNVALP